MFSQMNELTMSFIIHYCNSNFFVVKIFSGHYTYIIKKIINITIATYMVYVYYACYIHVSFYIHMYIDS